MWTSDFNGMPLKLKVHLGNGASERVIQNKVL